MRITIVGGGNIGTIFAVHCAEKGHEVTIYTSDASIYDTKLNIVDGDGKSIHEGFIKQATNDPVIAFKDSDMIIVTYPAMMMEKIAEVIFENAGSNAMIGAVPGSGGSECAFRKCIERGNIFFGLERVPAIARLVTKGRTVQSKGYKSELHIASIPSDAAEKCCGGDPEGGPRHGQGAQRDGHDPCRHQSGQYPDHDGRKDPPDRFRQREAHHAEGISG